MIAGYSRLVCSRTFESLRLVHNFSVEPTSEVAMNPHEGSVPFGSREPISFGVRNGRSCCRPDILPLSLECETARIGLNKLKN
jgi:hypothetical protein